jgi:hypothetical protein
LDELKTTNILTWVRDFNKSANTGKPTSELGWIDPELNALLPQAFPEGSPMHPSYGAGHATVAGACTTVLKAYYEMFTLDPTAVPRGSIKPQQFESSEWEALFQQPLKLTDQLSPTVMKLSDNFRTNADGSMLLPQGDLGLTIEGEINKIATNIAIGRDWAGVHFYSDYYESLRLGERIAVGILQEQMLTYREPVTMRFTSFDGDRIFLSGSGGHKGLDDGLIHVRDENGIKVKPEFWWNRPLLEA